ncbi:DltD N-terminal domain protein [Hypoxylon sp. FL1150]|nr:DltD N-terminal domain protein [Hypoxylon sp. FL1150]
MASQEDVEFKTADGITLRGRIYAAKERGPGVVMSPGFNAVKELAGVPATAAAFQAAGITALVYDPRTVGLSDGEPRNDINPFREIDDLSDALTFLSSHASVDSRQGVGLWGMSLGGATAMCAAALDPRAWFVVAVAPATEYTHDAAKLSSVLAKAAKDRESRVKGNEPFYVPMLNAKGENPAGFNLGMDRDAGMRLLSLQDASDSLKAALAPNHVNRTTVGTYRNLLLWEPRHMWKYLGKTAVMFLIPENDHLIGRDAQLRHYELLPGPKRLHVQSGVGHMDVLEGPSQPLVHRHQVEFVQDALAGKVSA